MAIHSQDAIRKLVEQPLQQPASFADSLSALDNTVANMQVSQVVEPAGAFGQQQAVQPPAVQR
jgi:hypothetical protein